MCGRWFCVACVTFGLTAIEIPDMIALSSGAPGHDHALLELIIFGSLGVSFVVILAFVVPATFQMFNLVTSVEGFKQERAI